MPSINIDQYFLMTAIAIGLIAIGSKLYSGPKTILLILLNRLFFETTVRWIYKPGENNVFYFNILTVTEFSLLLLFYKQALANYVDKKYMHLLLLLLPSLCLINIFLFQGKHVFSTYTFTLGAILVDILGAIYIYKTFEKTEVVRLQNEPDFWIVIGLLFYFTSTVSILGIINYQSLLPKPRIAQMRGILLSINCIFYILFIIAFLCQINIRKFTRNSSPTSSSD